MVEITTLEVVTALVGAFIILFGLVSMFIKEKIYLSEAFVSLAFGIIFGPIAAGLIVPQSWAHNMHEITEEYTRIVIIVQVMAAAVALPKHYVWKEWKSLLMFLIPILVYMWIVSGLFIWLLIPNLDLIEALAISSCITPTDPILANSIVKGKFADEHVPPHVRNILSAESGANDGFALPLLFLTVYLKRYPAGEAIAKWFYWVWAYEVALAVLIGGIVGFVARKLLKQSERRKLIDKDSFLVFSIALALFLMGVIGIMDGDDFVSVFVAGIVFTWDDWFRRETEDAHFQEVIEALLNMTIFVYLGAIIPWSSFGNAAIDLSVWRLLVLSILILLFRRIPIVILLKPFIPATKNFRESLFCGHFGPIGVGAIYYAMVIEKQLADNQRLKDVTFPVVSFVVIASVVVHGVTIPLFHLGSQITTRTLTRTSIQNQVLRLPLVKIGQPIPLRREDGELGSMSSEGVKVNGIENGDITVNVPLSESLPEQSVSIELPKHPRNQENLSESSPDEQSILNASSSTKLGQ
ncbi:uncharacterized protein VTP21DRAFT_8397 [Calcarisporiella thermophila]|uniref:uncharacterized protein n=1 Tax=Calcarisporiella thermophila TaxID=911321 RepID=UPI0037446E26